MIVSSHACTAELVANPVCHVPEKACKYPTDCIIYALQEAIIDRYEDVVVKSDSELLIRQLKGEYKVKNANLRPYYDQFLHLSRGLNNLDVVSIDRKENSLADKLANKAIDSRIDSSLKNE